METRLKRPDDFFGGAGIHDGLTRRPRAAEVLRRTTPGASGAVGDIFTSNGRNAKNKGDETMARKNEAEKPSDPITFNIYLDPSGTASTMLYEDDGVSPAYKEGNYRRTRIDVRRGGTGFVIDIRAAEGSYNPGERTFRFQIPSYEYVSKTVTAPGDGRAHQVELK